MFAYVKNRRARDEAPLKLNRITIIQHQFFTNQPFHKYTNSLTIGFSIFMNCLNNSCFEGNIALGREAIHGVINVMN